MLRSLTKEEFESTIAIPMQDVTATAIPAVHIWQYAAGLAENGLLPGDVLNRSMVEKVYRNAHGTYDHVLLPAGSRNVFIVVLVDINNTSVFGHYLLDLNTEYSLNKNQ
ncbi:MAG TPA: hypothetical protein PLZ45_15850 [Ferruginibacter sp.]|nr:hypothetical protein [Ferruginibacter sp.]